MLPYKTIIRIQSVTELNRLSRSSVYKLIGEGLFPPPIPISDRAVGWFQDEVQAVIDARISGKSKDEIRAIVAAFITTNPNRFSAYNPNSSAKLLKGRAKFIADVRAGSPIFRLWRYRELTF